MLKKLKEMYAATPIEDRPTTFGEFLQITVDAYDQDNANCESFDEFIDYEYSQRFYW